MFSSSNIIHILNPKAGGHTGLVFPLIKAGASDAGHSVAFFGEGAVPACHAERCEEMGVPWRAWRKRSPFDLRGLREMAEWIVSLKPTAVVVHDPLAITACLWARRRLPALRIIAVEHQCNALKTRKDWLFSAVLARAAERVVYLTEIYRDEVRRKLGRWFQESKSSVIASGLDLTAYPVSDPRHHASQPFVIGMQGRMIEGQDYVTLLRALAIANRQPGAAFRLELAGDGPCRDGLQKLALELGVASDVSFLGFLSPRTLARRMACWNACVHCTAGESLSLAVMEAQACALPIVASDVSGVRNCIDHGENGLLVPSNDAAALAGALHVLAANEDMRYRFARAGREQAEAKYSATLTWQMYSMHLRPARPAKRARLTAALPFLA